MQVSIISRTNKAKYMKKNGKKKFSVRNSVESAIYDLHNILRNHVFDLCQCATSLLNVNAQGEGAYLL